MESNDGDGSIMDAAIQLLSHTAELVKLLKDKCPISSQNDSSLVLWVWDAWQEIGCGEDTV